MERNADQLFQDCLFVEALGDCVEQINNGTANARTYAVAAKSAIRVSSPTIAEVQRSYTNCIKKACQSIILENAADHESLAKKLYQLRNEIRLDNTAYGVEFLRGLLEKLVTAPSIDGLKIFEKARYDYLSLQLTADISFENYILAAADLENMSKEAAEKKYSSGNEEKAAEAAAERAISDTLRDCGKRVFTDTKTYFESNNQGTREAIAALIGLTIDRFTVAFLMYDECEFDGEDFEKFSRVYGNEDAVQILMEHAEILNYMLEATAFPDKKAISLFMSGREFYMNKLKEVYAKIRKIDPTFEEPELPPLEAVGEQQTDISSGGSSGGCYVATAVYGSYDCPQVWTLRRFRDFTLAKTWYGRTFIRSYYAISPTLVKWFGHTEWFKALWRGRLDKMVTKLNSDGVKDTPYEDKVW